MKVIADRSLCQGHAQCEGAAPRSSRWMTTHWSACAWRTRPRTPVQGGGRRALVPRGGHPHRGLGRVSKFQVDEGRDPNVVLPVPGGRPHTFVVWG